ncbi:MAG: hypothetical protein MUP92_03835 [Actinobacteria bacterium]|nr:hypothetical protein [Actinomycetota bacterium]
MGREGGPHPHGELTNADRESDRRPVGLASGEDGVRHHEAIHVLQKVHYVCSRSGLYDLDAVGQERSDPPSREDA